VPLLLETYITVHIEGAVLAGDPKGKLSSSRDGEAVIVPVSIVIEPS
jgi:hypothetical protein